MQHDRTPAIALLIARPFKRSFMTLLVAATVTLAALSVSLHANEPAPPATPSPEAQAANANVEGRTLFVTNCAACHGLAGHGDGPAAEHLFPIPRAFADVSFRFEATGQTVSSVRKAIEHTIRRGVIRSAMPGFEGVLTDHEIDALRDYVYKLTPKPKYLIGPQGAQLEKLMATKPRRFTNDMVRHGLLLYQTKACINCHGKSGHGDGIGRNGLVDSLNRPIWPADLASGLYKSGQRPEDLFRTIVEGVPGTPMPPYGPMLLKEMADGSQYPYEVWALVSYIQSLAPKTLPHGISSGGVLPIQQLPRESMLINPADFGWLAVDMKSLIVKRLKQRIEKTITVHVAAVKAGAYVGVHLWWPDETPDYNPSDGGLPDAAAVMFAMGDEVPALPMGIQIQEHHPAAPVNIWRWEADRQMNASSISDLRTTVDTAEAQDTESYHIFPLGSSPTKTQPFNSGGISSTTNTSSAATTSDQLRANKDILAHAVLEANALGFGNIQYQSADRQQVYSSAVWSNGRWFVTCFRRMQTGDINDIDLMANRNVAVAFALWNGAAGDKLGDKQVSAWHWIDTASQTQSISATAEVEPVSK